MGQNAPERKHVRPCLSFAKSAVVFDRLVTGPAVHKPECWCLMRPYAAGGRERERERTGDMTSELLQGKQPSKPRRACLVRCHLRISRAASASARCSAHWCSRQHWTQGSGQAKIIRIAQLGQSASQITRGQTPSTEVDIKFRGTCVYGSVWLCSEVSMAQRSLACRQGEM